MGIGTKLKDALQGDKQTHQTATDTSNTPGSYPSEEVPRTHNHNETHGNSHGLNSTSEPRTEKLPGRNSAEYTYGSKTGTTGNTTSATGRHGHEIPGTHQDAGLGHKGVSGASATSTGNKLTKGHNDPYWGDSERRTTHEPGTASGAYGSTGSDLNAREINDRYNSTSQGGDFGHTGAASHNTGRHENLTGGTTGRDHDRYNTPGSTTHTSTTTTTGYGSSNTRGGGLGSSGAPEGTHGPHGSRVANAADPRVDSDRDHRAAPGTAGVGSSGTTSNLPHRPHDTDTSRRDYKTDEYDAPTNSSGRGHTGAGVAGGAAAGYGASKLADRHHEHDAREKDPSFGGQQYGERRGNDAYDNVGSREHGSGVGAGLLDPHSRNTATQPGTGAGTSMLDPYGAESGSTGHHTGHHTGHTTGAGSGPGAGTIRLQDSYPEGHQGHSAGSGIGHHTGNGSDLGADSHLQSQYPEGRQGHNTASSGLGAGSGLHESSHLGHPATGSGAGVSTGSHVPGVRQGHHATSGLGSGEHESYGRDTGSNNLGSGGNFSQDSAEYSQEGSNLAKGHFGPGHDGAKVMHKCDKCGHDNDISKHFRKDAVYRMG
ncbi:hypothetical protein SCAR479_07728 [Seiridium cardinale]|uniref:Cell surface protein n=1 Tax=Seiridium cardinale TaxID=138064 RepID=A0ABR2XP95_9PEZI